MTSNILPHFRGIHRTISENSGYLVGIYAPRNVCSRVGEAGYAGASFVSDMSSGFSGNLGFPLPSNWSFDQIVTVSVGSGSGTIEIDKNIASGRDEGQNSFDPSFRDESLDVGFDESSRDAALRDVQNYLTGIGVPETGGDGWTDDDWATLGGFSTTESFNAVIDRDWLFTSLARRLKLRKALIQAPILWEIRKFNPLDIAADEAVKAGAKDDASTGLGQIFAWVAIDARNYCVRQGIINGPILSADSDLEGVWTKLNEDHVYNIKTAAYLTIYNAHQIDVARPAPDTGEDVTQQILARYNGTNEDAQQYGRELIGLYRVLEKYNAIARKN